MGAPRKQQKKRKTGRPLEDVPLRKLLANVRAKLDPQVKMAFSSGEERKPKQE